METAEEIQYDLKLKKSVHFAHFNGRENSVFTKKPKVSTMKKTWFHHLRYEEYDLLTQKLSEFNARGVSNELFFEQEGLAILRWSVEDALTAKPLEFICHAVEDQMLLRNILMRDNYSILRGLIFTESGLDEYDKSTDESREVRVLKLKTLLAIDFSGMKNFFAENKNEPWFGEGIRFDMQNALLEHEVAFPSRSARKKNKLNP
jgi:hypothetical protein